MITFANGLEVLPRANTASGSYDVEASSAGFAPGVWPKEVTVTLAARGMEPEMPITFGFVMNETIAGELNAMHYETRLGMLTLTVWND